MKDFLKDNIALVAAIALPALLAVVFALSTALVSVAVESPKHDFLIATDYYEQNSPFQLDVAGDRLTISYLAPEKDAQGNPIYRNAAPRLWRVHAPDMSVEEISLKEPGDKKSASITIAGITDIKVQNISPGPDGYEFTNSYGYDGNLMTEIFSGGRRDSAVGVTKNGRLVRVKIPDGNGYYSYNTRFIGWITE